MPAIYEHPYLVRPEDTDGVGHAGNVSYVRWLQDAAIAHATAQGWPPERHLSLGNGWVVRSHFIEYLRPAHAGDQIVVRTWVAGFKRITSLRKYQILRPADGTLLARAETNWAYVSFESHAPRRIPRDVVDAFEIVTPELELPPP
jgi:acyl-CoA thioester hydrolase